MTRPWRFGLLVLMLSASGSPAVAAELKPEHVAQAKGDGPDGKGNTTDDTWQFWFELAQPRSQFHPLDTYSTSVPGEGIPRKVTGPIAGSLPNPGDTEGWIFHRDWDGRFEGIWADRKTNQVLAYPYVEKNTHLAVAVTYKVPADGIYRISGVLTDVQVQPQFEQHDGVEWILELVEGGKSIRKIGTGGPIGDGKGRPDSDRFQFPEVVARKGQLVRLVIHPRKWWGSDLTRIEAFRIVPASGDGPG
jgi:hypothetical protein